MQNTIKKLTKVEALELLADCDHGFLSPEGARKMAEPFGVEPALYQETVNSREFKGLSVPGKRDGERVEGIAAHVLAEQICRKVGVGTGADIGIEGKGSRLRFAIEQIQKKLTEGK